MPAPTVVTQGAALPTVPGAGPWLPPAAATKTPAAEAARKARDRVSPGSSEPVTEKLSTSTPSATAWSTAATASAVEQPSSAGSGAVQQAL